MERDKPQQAIARVCSEKLDKVLSRRQAVAGVGLIGLFLAAPKLFAPGAAQAKELSAPVEAAAHAAPATDNKKAEVAEPVVADATDTAEVTDFSAQRWRRRYWRRRYWRPRRYWRRRYWRRRYWY
jgi:hypothetical protein